MLFTKAAVALAILDLAAAATTCAVAGAKAWPAGSNFGTTFGGGGGGIYGGAQSIADCSAFCKQDLACVTGCDNLILAGQCNAVGGSACETSSSGTKDPSEGLIKLKKRSTNNKRATLTCSTAETCYQYTDKSLLCINMSDGSYHDDVGGNGSLKDGTYTSPSGVVQTGTGTPPAGAATVTSTTSRRSATGIGNSPVEATGAASGTTASRTGAASNTASQIGAAAAATSSSAAELLRAGGVVMGALGLAIGIVL